MISVTISIQDVSYPRVVAAVAARYSYRATLPNPANPAGPQILNPQTREQFLKSRILEFLLESVRIHEATGSAAVESNRLAALQRVNTEIVMS